MGRTAQPGLVRSHYARRVHRIFTTSGASLITGSVCGVQVQEVEDPLMQKVRYLDKLVDELAKGRPMSKVLRSPT
jgi:hypothetical protein